MDITILGLLLLSFVIGSVIVLFLSYFILTKITNCNLEDRDSFKDGCIQITSIILSIVFLIISMISIFPDDNEKLTRLVNKYYNLRGYITEIKVDTGGNKKYDNLLDKVYIYGRGKFYYIIGQKRSDYYRTKYNELINK